jgi:hypothetical protein
MMVMEKTLAIQKAFADLCDAMQRLERSVAPVADSHLLGECSTLRKKAEAIILASIHPRQR